MLPFFSRFHIGEYVCPLFTVNCRVFKFPSKMQAETGQIGNGLKLTKKAKNDFESFTSHAHAKITKKQLENTYKSYCLPFKKKYLYDFFRLPMVGAFNNYVDKMVPNFDTPPSLVNKMDILHSTYYLTFVT